MLKEDIKDWMDEDGLVTPNFKPARCSTGNGLLYTSIYYILLKKLDLFDAIDLAHFTETVSKCQSVTETRLLDVYYAGLFHRAPCKKMEQNSKDDYIGIASASNILGAVFAKDILDYGKDSSRYFLFHWIYNNINPGILTGQAWFGRFNEVIAHFQWSAGSRPNLMRQIYFCVHILIAGLFDSTNSTPMMLSWLMLESSKDKSVLVRITNWIWYKRLKLTYKNGFKDVLSNHLGEFHPLAKWCNF